MAADPLRTPTRRADGERTHAAILDAAMRVASVDGLEGLTIGRLADELGVSKSGVYSHFRSKDRLQRETIAAATEVFTREVIEPGLAAGEGLAGLTGLCEAFLSYVERGVFPGGCFFAGLLAEFDGRSGPIHDDVVTGNLEWSGLLTDLADAARDRGELASDADLPQLTFELDAAMELANYLYVLHQDPEIIDRARRAIRGAIDRRRHRSRERSAP